eukprot:Amastigsp_a512768_109.p2 type:complete len:421 gc:universal Amastigsp_a512768_109:314-1576(+)
MRLVGLSARRLVDGARHRHLCGAAAEDHARLGRGLREHAEGVMERALGLVEQLLRRAAEHDRARRTLLAAREADEAILADEHLVDEGARAEDDLLGVVKRRHDLAAGDRSESLDAIKVRVLDGHDAGVGKELLGVVVDELAVDEHIDVVREDALDLGLHLGALGELDLGDLVSLVDTHARRENFDLVRVHRRVGDQNARVLNALGLADADLLLEKEPVCKERVCKRPADLLDDLNRLEVRRTAETHHGVHAHLCEEVLVVEHNLRRERRPRNVEKILAVLASVCDVRDRQRLERPRGNSRSCAEPGNDHLRMHFLVHKRLGLTEKHRREDAHRRRPVANLVVLSLRDLDEDLRRGVVNEHVLQNRRAVVRHNNRAALTAAETLGLQNLVHALRTKSRLDEIADGNRAHKRRQARKRAALL